MARYREGEIPKEQLAIHASDEMLIFTAVLGFVIGIILTTMGYKGKVLWLAVWGYGLILVSLHMAISMIWDIKFFGFF